VQFGEGTEGVLGVRGQRLHVSRGSLSHASHGMRTLSLFPWTILRSSTLESASYVFSEKT